MKTLRYISFALIIVALLAWGNIRNLDAGETMENETPTKSATITITCRTIGELGEIIK